MELGALQHEGGSPFPVMEIYKRSAWLKNGASLEGVGLAEWAVLGRSLDAERLPGMY